MDKTGALKAQYALCAANTCQAFSIVWKFGNFWYHNFNTFLVEENYHCYVNDWHNSDNFPLQKQSFILNKIVLPLISMFCSGCCHLHIHESSQFIVYSFSFSAWEAQGREGVYSIVNGTETSGDTLWGILWNNSEGSWTVSCKFT